MTGLDLDAVKPGLYGPFSSLCESRDHSLDFIDPHASGYLPMRNGYIGGREKGLSRVSGNAFAPP